MIDQSQVKDTWLAGMDVGGTKIEAILVDKAGVQIGQVYLPMDAQSDERAVVSIVAALRRLLEEASLPAGRLQGVGVAIPGKITPGGGRVGGQPEAQKLSLGQRTGRYFRHPLLPGK